MLQKFTKKELPSGDPVQNIEKLLKEFANSSKPSYQRGLYSEYLAIKFLIKRGHHPVFHRFHSFYGEVDWITYFAPQQLLVLNEVKSSQFGLENYRLKQKNSLLRLAEEIARQDHFVHCQMLIKNSKSFAILPIDS